MPSVPPRSKIKKERTWNAESVFPSVEAWEEEMKKIVENVSSIKQYQGRLSESPETLLSILQAYDALLSRAYIAQMYANFTYSVDTTDQQAVGMRSRAQSMIGQVISAGSFIQPEVLQIGKAKLEEWMGQPSGKKLEVYRHTFDDLFRKQEHVRSAEVEEILGMTIDPLEGPYSSFSMLTNADFTFKPVKDSEGNELDVTQGTVLKLVRHPERGKEYVDILRKGCLEDRWVDVYPNLGKSEGAFSAGAQGTYPFIMMSYNDEMVSMSTLAHELGHSMHSYLTWKHQPFVYTDYSLFIAEVASNFHQAMVRSHLLNTVKDKNFQIALIEEAVGSNFFRYFFQMPTLARFELETHQRIERGESLTADSMIDLMADLFAEGFGPGFKMDRERVGMTWATFPHLYADYYVYSYATGISGAHALSGRILRGEPNAVEDYLSFLKSGSSDYSLNVLKKAGVDLASPQPVMETFAVMESYVDRLEKLLS